MTEHKHTVLVEGCYRCDLNKDEIHTPMQAAADSLYDWLPVAEHRAEASREVVAAALDAAEGDIANALSKAWAGATVWDMVQEIRKIMLGEEEE